MLECHNVALRVLTRPDDQAAPCMMLCFLSLRQVICPPQGISAELVSLLPVVQGVRYLRGAVTILLQLNEVLKEKHNEALVVTLVTDGVLQAAADYCLGLVRCQKVEVSGGHSLALLRRMP